MFLRDKRGNWRSPLHITSCSAFLRSWGASATLHPTPTCPRAEESMSPQAPLSLIHSSFPRSSAARPFPRATLEHNGLAALRFHDTASWCSPTLSNAGSQHFHTVRTLGTPSRSHSCPSPSQAPRPRRLICKLEPDPWEGDLEAAVLGGLELERGHSCLLEREVSP